MGDGSLSIMNPKDNFMSSYKFSLDKDDVIILAKSDLQQIWGKSNEKYSEPSNFFFSNFLKKI